MSNNDNNKKNENDKRQEPKQESFSKRKDSINLNDTRSDKPTNKFIPPDNPGKKPPKP